MKKCAFCAKRIHRRRAHAEGAETDCANEFHAKGAETKFIVKYKLNNIDLKIALCTPRKKNTHETLSSNVNAP